MELAVIEAPIFPKTNSGTCFSYSIIAFEM
jgi:hypothetical protein